MDRMKKALLRERLIGSVAILILFILSFVFIMQPRLSAPGKISDQTKQEQAKLDGLIAQETSLYKEQAKLSEKQKVAVAISQKFPAKANPPELVALAKAEAEQSGIPASSVLSVTVGDPVQFTPGAAAGATAAPAPAATGAPAAGAPPAAGAGQIYSIAVTITVNSTLSQASTYITTLSGGPRSIYVTAMTSGPVVGSDGKAGTQPTGVYQNKLTGQTFLLPPFTQTPPKQVTSKPPVTK